MAILRSILYFSMLANYVFIKGEIYSTCYVDETYCLFSFGPNVTVNNVKKAQEICEDAKHGSWLLDITNNNSENVKEFFSNHFFHEDTMFILKDGKIRMLNKKYSTTRTNDDKQFSIVCVADCPFKFDLLKDKGYFHGDHYKLDTEEQCLKLCEETKCKAYEWNPNNGCWIHKKLIGNMKSKDNNKLYVRNMSPRTDDCLGDVKNPFQGDFNSNQDFTIVLIVLVVIIIGLAITCFIVCHACGMRRKNRRNRLKEVEKDGETGTKRKEDLNMKENPLPNPYVSSLPSTKVRGGENDYDDVTTSTDDHLYERLEKSP